jgi:hypothetical protein
MTVSVPDPAGRQPSYLTLPDTVLLFAALMELGCLAGGHVGTGIGAALAALVVGQAVLRAAYGTPGPDAPEGPEDPN